MAINLIAPWLSHPIGTGPSETLTAIPSADSLSMRLNQRLFQVACEQVIYSASSVESATTLWDLACQWISPDMINSSLTLMYPRPNTHPPTDFRVVRFPAQSESAYPMIFIGIS